MNSPDWLMVLVLAHLAGDFVLLPLFEKKKKGEDGSLKMESTQELEIPAGELVPEARINLLRAPAFWYHLGMHAGLSLFAAIWIGWWALLVAPVVAVLHGSIQGGVQRLLPQQPLNTFLVTQFLHLLSLWAVWSIAAGFEVQAEFFQQFSLKKGLIFGIGYLIAWYPLSTMIQMATRRWQDAVPVTGLPDAGKWIGRIERFLILTFILINQFQAIGYLLAAKSIFRFGDLQDPKNHQRTEYILIGTLVSFSVTLVLGLGVKMLLTRI